MPLTQISLSRKLILLLLLPAAVQLGIVAGLGALQYKAAAEAASAERARQVYNAADTLMRNMLRMLSVTDPRAYLGHTPDAQAVSQEQTSIYKQFTTLKGLLKDSPKDLQVVLSSEKLCLQSMAIVQQLKEMHLRGDYQDHPERRPLTAQLRRLVQQMVSQELVDLADRQCQLADRGPIVERSLRHQGFWLIAILGAVNAALTIALGVFLVRRIAMRLERMADNGYYQAEGSPLHPAEMALHPDEITTIDHSFHEMAERLGQLTAKQDALVDNAADMVCAMTEEGKITSANAAAGKLFACHPAELIDKNYRDLVHPLDVSLLSNHLQRALANGSDTAVKLRLVGRNQRILHVLWSAQWTDRENQFFSVVHDLTQLQEAQTMKQEVVAIVANDLQHPLAHVQSFFHSLANGEAATVTEEREQSFNLARRNANHISTLVNDLVDLEKAKNGLLALSAGQLNLDKIIDQAQVVIGPFAEAKDVVLDCRRGGLTVSGEEDKLIRVFTNLLGNAVRYAPRETSILVVSKSQDGFAQVNISDKGPGISAQNIGTIFDAFSPSAAGENIELSCDMVEDLPPGSVGLALTKAFIELHGGKISAASKAGEGTTFSFTLPLDLGKF